MRLYDHDFGNEGGANQKPALQVLYGLVVAQGMLFVYKTIHALGTRNKLAEFAASKIDTVDQELLAEYLEETIAGCEKDPSLPPIVGTGSPYSNKVREHTMRIVALQFPGVIECISSVLELEVPSADEECSERRKKQRDRSRVGLLTEAANTIQQLAVIKDNRRIMRKAVIPKFAMSLLKLHTRDDDHGAIGMSLLKRQTANGRCRRRDRLQLLLLVLEEKYKRWW
ncbi:hypothetical protein HU200_008827 [Digitaria exilis]|uniref:Uncharacterized protein n=1 Tax=Digitaria exilis TaxID=1010633 RepID=A0A835FKH2_9POAL|nr:hypothetical protein HU200_008827 [Digitaria exilis]